MLNLKFLFLNSYCIVFVPVKKKEKKQLKSNGKKRSKNILHVKRKGRGNPEAGNRHERGGVFQRRHCAWSLQV